MSKNQKIIIYQDRQKLILASTGLPAPLTLDIPSSLVFDIEVIDPDGFNHLVSTWLEQNGIIPTNVIIVLSAGVYFALDSVSTNDVAHRKSQMDNFLETIPYKNLFSKEYLFANQLKLIAINKDFYEPLLRFLKRQRFEVNALLPVFLLDNLQLKLVEFSSKEVVEVYNKLKTLETYSLISPQEIDKTMSVTVRRAPENKTRKIVLISVFCGLWVILIALLFIRPKLYKPTPTPALKKPVVNDVSFVSTPTPPVVEPTISYLLIDQIKIKVINSSGVSNQAGKIRDLLTTSGFKNITVSTSSKVIGAKNQIRYSPVVSSELLTLMSDKVAEIAGDSTLVLTQDLTDTDVIITLVSQTN